MDAVEVLDELTESAIGTVVGMAYDQAMAIKALGETNIAANAAMIRSVYTASYGSAMASLTGPYAADYAKLYNVKALTYGQLVARGNEALAISPVAPEKLPAMVGLINNVQWRAQKNALTDLGRFGQQWAKNMQQAYPDVGERRRAVSAWIARQSSAH